MQLLLRVLVAVLAGFLLSTLVAPWGFHRLHWVAYLPVFWMLRADTPRQNRWLVFLYGTVAEALIFSWIADTITLFSNLPSVVAWAVTGLFAVVFGLPYFFTFSVLHPMRERLGALWIVVLPSWLVVVEWATSIAILFPYNQGVSQFKEPLIWQVVSVTGVWGLSWVVLFVNATMGEWIYRRREGGKAPVAWMLSAVSLLSLLVMFGAWRFERVEATLAQAPLKRVQQLQSGDSMLVRLRQPRSEAFGFWVGETATLPRGSTDLAVWPEASVPYQLNSGTAILTAWDLVADLDLDLVVGAGTREREPDPEMEDDDEIRVFNSVYAFDRSRLSIAEPATPAGDLTELQANGCDLDKAHVRTPYEAMILREVGARTGGIDSSCLTILAERERDLRAEMKAGPPLEALLRDDPAVWSKLRAQTARLTGKLVEKTYGQRRGTWFWVLAEATCSDDDCRRILVRCSGADGCAVYPEAPHYDKMVPLPFGEYLPLGTTFPWLADLIKGPGNFRAGTEALVFEMDGARLATPICYEGILGYLCDDFESPDLFLNLTNDAWFGDTAASDLHGMLVAIRAVELGVPVFRSAYSGISFVVEPHGKIYAETELFVPSHRVVPVRMATVDTIYRRFGDWFVWLCLMVVGLAWLRRHRPGPA